MTGRDLLVFAVIGLIGLAMLVRLLTRRLPERTRGIVELAGGLFLLGAIIGVIAWLDEGPIQPTAAQERQREFLDEDPAGVRAALERHAPQLAAGLVVTVADERLLVTGGDDALVETYGQLLTHADAHVRRDATRWLLASGHPIGIERVTGRLIRAWIDRSLQPGSGPDDDIAAAVAASAEARERFLQQASLPPYRDLAVVDDASGGWTLASRGRPVLVLAADGSWRWGSTTATLGLPAEASGRPTVEAPAPGAGF